MWFHAVELTMSCHCWNLSIILRRSIWVSLLVYLQDRCCTWVFLSGGELSEWRSVQMAIHGKFIDWHSDLKCGALMRSWRCWLQWRKKQKAWSSIFGLCLNRQGTWFRVPSPADENTVTVIVISNWHPHTYYQSVLILYSILEILECSRLWIHCLRFLCDKMVDDNCLEFYKFLKHIDWASDLMDLKVLPGSKLLVGGPFVTLRHHNIVTTTAR